MFTKRVRIVYAFLFLFAFTFALSFTLASQAQAQPPEPDCCLIYCPDAPWMTWMRGHWVGNCLYNGTPPCDIVLSGCEYPAP
jgi:hypothetical protein